MCDRNSEGEDPLKKNRRDILKYGSATALATVSIPSLTAAQEDQRESEKEERNHSERYVSNNEKDVIKRIVEEDNYYITKSTAGGSQPTYFKEWTAGENEGEIKEIPPSDPDIPDEHTEEILTTLSSDDCESTSDVTNVISDVDSINRETYENCNGRGIDDDAYGVHKYVARTARLRTTIAALCTATLNDLVAHLLEPLGIPFLAQVVTTIVSVIGAWTTNEITLGIVDSDGRWSNIPYMKAAIARSYNANFDAVTRSGSFPGHIEHVL